MFQYVMYSSFFCPSFSGERDPKKRKVKPVDKHLLQLDFGGLEDSSDDSDYEVADYQDGESRWQRHRENREF